MNQMMDFDNKETTQTQISGSLRPFCSSLVISCENVGTQDRTEKLKGWGRRNANFCGAGK